MNKQKLMYVCETLCPRRQQSEKAIFSTNVTRHWCHLKGHHLLSMRAEYEASISFSAKIIANVKVGNRQTDRTKIHVFVKHYVLGGDKVLKTIFSTKVKVKVTRSLTLVSCKSTSLVKYACQI